VKILGSPFYPLLFGFGQSNDGVSNPKIELLQRVCSTNETFFDDGAFTGANPPGTKSPTCRLQSAP
jgi:hypothetical protein